MCVNEIYIKNICKWKKMCLAKKEKLLISFQSRLCLFFFKGILMYLSVAKEQITLHSRLNVVKVETFR